MIYQYDKLNRLLVADNSASSSYDVGVGNELSYDANGNLKDLKRGTVTKNYNYYLNTNMVKNVDGSGNDYSYDHNGNTAASVNKGITNISYDPFINLATSVNLSGLTNLTYGANSQRTLKSDSYSTTAYIHGMSDFPLMEKVDDGSSEVTKLYVYGPTGLIAVNDDDGWFFMLKDHLGSTRVVLDESNDFAANYNYMPYGNTFNNTVGPEVSYQFTGQEYDTETELHNFRARLYDSDLGMFYAVDPAGQGFSSFGYAGNNPINYIDKDGQIFIIDDLLIGAAVGALFSGLTYSATSGGDWTWEGFGTAVGLGAVGGGLSAGLGMIGGSIANNTAYSY